jgi:TM2 domain-containing membrane protein YozV
MLLPALVVFSLGEECAALPTWLYNCTIPRDVVDENSPTYSVNCDSSGKRALDCQPFVNCSGPLREFTVNCVPVEGKSVGTALVLSVLFGWLGADRFYLGYPTIGVFKLFTGGFFGLGWYLDIFMIALRITTPAGGIPYKFEAGANFLIRLPGVPYY